MARLNKGEAMEAVRNTVMAAAEVQNALPEHLRLMDIDQMRKSALLVFTTSMLMPDTHRTYTVAVQDEGIRSIMTIWRNKINEFERTDPTCIAEREAESFTYNLDYMIREAQETLARFKKHLETDPAYAFTSTAAVQAAGNLDVAMRAKNMLTKYSVAEVKTELTNSLRYSFRIDGSTCPMTNLVDRAKQVAAAKLVGLNG